MFQRSQRCPLFVVWVASKVLVPTHLNESASYCRINNRKELHFWFKMNMTSHQLFVWFVRMLWRSNATEGSIGTFGWRPIFCTYPRSSTSRVGTQNHGLGNRDLIPTRPNRLYSEISGGTAGGFSPKQRLGTTASDRLNSFRAVSSDRGS